MNRDVLLEAIDAIYSAAGSPALWPDALQSIANCSGDVGAIMIFQRENGALGTICTPSLEMAQRDYERGEWWRYDIRFKRTGELGYLANTDAVTDRHVCSDEEMQSLPYFTTFLRSHDLKWFGGVNISPDPKFALALSVQRRADKPAFGDDELAVLSRLGRHVEQALRLGIRLIRAEAGQATLADVLSKLDVGIYFLDEAARVVFQNEAALAMEGKGLSVVGGRVSVDATPQREELRAAIAAVISMDGSTFSAAPARPVLVPTSDETGYLAIHTLPVRHGPDRIIDKLLAGVSGVVVVSRSVNGDPIDPALLRDLFGLTLGEARVATLIGAGIAPRDASKRLGITEQTTRTVLKRIFAKTGVMRQSELAALLSRLVLRQ
ncbi:hypothetical protein IP69_14660 [Bosea sp. AAP35]|uniref:helix-turn-helix transcriptional regulator n=1 Tax=Bosea sp. AAP35 TaxID=1523417 RepID=UPI0006CD4FEE|nr:helix-turn-helix transcriptional regulator [Bosea sp. AAP35]KPF66551.1 hypothetical protein IP69_14660 [Bosea sp. AAP35]